MKSFMLFILLCLSPFPLVSVASTDALGELIIATRHVPPFAIKDEDGNWQGISIELWRTLADKLNFEYQFKEMGLKEMLEAVEAHEVDAAVAALTITSEREKQLDFTHPFLSTGLGIAVPMDNGGGWLAVTQRFISPAFLKVTAALLGLLLLVGLLIWLFERRHNNQFGGNPVQGIGTGLWWSAVTMTTVGYGDKAPQTFVGRALAVVWMFASIIIISTFTAAIATALTVGELGGKVEGKDDLARVRVASVVDSTSANYLQDKQIGFRAQPNLETALNSLSGKTFDAVVYDAPILRYQIRNQYIDDLMVLPGIFARQDYGIALPSDSPHREAINLALLEALREPAWEASLYRYLGKTE